MIIAGSKVSGPGSLHSVGVWTFVGEKYDGNVGRDFRGHLEDREAHN